MLAVVMGTGSACDSGPSAAAAPGAKTGGEQGDQAATCFSASLPDWLQAEGVESFVDGQPGTWEFVGSDAYTEISEKAPGTGSKSFHTSVLADGTVKINCENMSATPQEEYTTGFSFAKTVSRTDGKRGELLSVDFSFQGPGTGKTSSFTVKSEASPAGSKDMVVEAHEAEAQGAKVGVFRANAGQAMLRLAQSLTLDGRTYKIDYLATYRLK